MTISSVRPICFAAAVGISQQLLGGGTDTLARLGPAIETAPDDGGASSKLKRACVWINSFYTTPI
jgi:hypothetical protein